MLFLLSCYGFSLVFGPFIHPSLYWSPLYLIFLWKCQSIHLSIHIALPFLCGTLHLILLNPNIFSNQRRYIVLSSFKSHAFPYFSFSFLFFVCLCVQKFPELKFKYVEEDQPEDFFIPYVWSLVFNSGVGLYWNPHGIELFSMDSGWTRK